MTEKRLFLLRHAQALNEAPSDAVRPLSPRGLEDARALGQLMARKSFVPDGVLCSPALRTRQTLEALQEGLGMSPDVIAQPENLYSGAAGAYLHEIQSLSDEHGAILVVGHNPSIYELVIRLSDPSHDHYMQKLSAGYNPATLSVLECPCEAWAEIQLAANPLTYLTEPLDYNAPARPTRWM